ncbi:DUF1573 domain-containing protein [Abyssalbus ytuae]|uniref:DUF1573 domain-containing protein n=1 Tax=Abyssalbus ytuae TaxID=2926907 RepID=A0A9E6ZMK3_9FLAO|nr:DUF1573 domain-containing protein [Abyssalbus ytuae]UOB16995.1 DUF1573 domain-containing protein [Abyssalbus ytuae]
MKKLVLLLFVGMMAFAVSAQDKTAKIEFKADEIDYGDIAKGSDGVRIFEFTNTGDVPLVISKVYSSCGCTIPKKPEEPILPGKTGQIEVKYDTKRVGPIRKTVTVVSNADTPTIALKIKGKVLDTNESGEIIKEKATVEKK